MQNIFGLCSTVGMSVAISFDDYDNWVGKALDVLRCNYTGPAVEDYVLQNGLVSVHANVTHIRITAAEPTTYAIASTSGVLGFRSFGVNATFGADTSASPTGRLVTSTAITDGTITTSGTAAWWAATDETNSRLMAHGSLSATQVVTSGNTFTLGAFTIRLPAQ